MANNLVDGDLRVNGNVTLLPTGAIFKPDITRANLEKNTLQRFPIKITELVVYDTLQPLPATSSGSIIGLYAGTYGTDTPIASSGDVKNSTTTRYARIVAKLPESYDNGTNVKIRISAGTKTTIASSSSTVDVEAYLVGRDSLVSGSDLCTTSAQSINSTTFADKDFVINAAALLKGDSLDIRFTLACVDVATGTAVKPTIADIELLCDIRG